MSPGLLIDLLESSGQQYSRLISAQDMHTNALFPVAWAGEEVSKNWFHIAREYTEKWHHQQQIREATGKQGILTDTLFYPCIATLLRGLPYTYRNTDAANGTVISITIHIEKEHQWYLVRHTHGWELTATKQPAHHAGIYIPSDIAWKLFTKALSPAEARKYVHLNGNEDLAEVALRLIAVMA